MVARAEEQSVLTPVQVLHEVHRWTRRHVGERAAMDVASHMDATRFVSTDVTAAIVAVDMGVDHGLAAADAMIHAPARLQRCELVTADADFRGLPGVTPLQSTQEDRA
jgi:predicted nucleic acid-binding protein